MQAQKTLRGRPIKGEKRRERITLTLEPHCINTISKKSKKLGLTRSDYVQSLINLSTVSVHNAKSVHEKILLPIFNAKLESFCIENKINKLSVFGSALGDEFKANSDLDLLVEFNRDAVISLFKISRIAKELSPLFGNRLIDLRTKEDLSQKFREEVIKNAELIYEDFSFASGI